MSSYVSYNQTFTETINQIISSRRKPAKEGIWRAQVHYLPDDFSESTTTHIYNTFWTYTVDKYPCAFSVYYMDSGQTATLPA